MIFGIYNMNLCCFTLRWYLWKVLEKNCVCVSTRHCFFDICEFDEPFHFTLVEGVAAVPPFVQVDHGISLCCKYLFPSPTMYGKSSKFNSKPPIIFNIKSRKVALSNNKYQQTYSHSPPPLHLFTSFNRKNTHGSHIYTYIYRR